MSEPSPVVLVVDDEAEMTAIVRGLPSSRLERQELIAQVDEGRTLAPTSQLEVEQAAVERERLVDVSDLECDMVQTHRAGLVSSGHRDLHQLLWPHGLAPVTPLRRRAALPRCLAVTAGPRATRASARSRRRPA